MNFLWQNGANPEALVFVWLKSFSVFTKLNALSNTKQVLKGNMALDVAECKAEYQDLAEHDILMTLYEVHRFQVCPF